VTSQSSKSPHLELETRTQNIRVDLLSTHNAVENVEKLWRCVW